MTVLLYGLGAVLIRETAARWRKGLPAIVLLGLAYGAISVFALGCGWIVSRLSFSTRGTVSMAGGFLVPMMITRLLAGALALVALLLALIALALFKAEGDLDAAGLVPDRPGNLLNDDANFR
jgi:hypothetical protein